MGIVSVAGVSAVSEGTLTRTTVDVTGTQQVSIAYPLRLILFSGLSDADATINCLGWDTGAIATCDRSLPLTVALTVVSLTTKSIVDSIYIANLAGNGWRAKVSATTGATFTLSWTKIGAGLNVSVRYAVIQ